VKSRYYANPCSGQWERLSEIICIVNETEATKALREARQLVKSEQYAAALEKYIWFHDHALDFDRALVGVRLSYAISEWVDLGEVYPPARSALESVRDAKAELLAQGTYDVSLFHDVALINRAFGQVDRTSDLFKSIANADRDVAAKCFNIALESLVRMKEFDLARSFISDPIKEIDHFARPLKFASQQTQSVSPEMMQETLVRIYVKKVNLLLQIFTGLGDEEMKRLPTNSAITRSSASRIHSFGITSGNSCILRRLPRVSSSFQNQLSKTYYR
jgi:hypothetical protein